jgi:hypothetical protein
MRDPAGRNEELIAKLTEARAELAAERTAGAALRQVIAGLSLELQQAREEVAAAVAEYPGLSAGQLRDELGAFHPPQGYVRLNQHRRLLAVCEKIAAETPVREMPVHHR